MSTPFLNRVKKGLGGFALYGYPIKFNRDKKDLIDFTFQKIRPNPQSFADLGGVWGIDGAYTFYTLDKYKIESAFLVDTDFNNAVVKKSRKYKNLNLVNKNFGDRSILSQLGQVDAVFFFDVLLHQVKPDWDEVLQMYSPVSNCYVVFNQQFTKSEKTVRLLDLGFDGYFENVPLRKRHTIYKNLFDKMYDIHPTHNKIWRDIHNVWQWGVTNRDLCAIMSDLGYSLRYQKNCGQFSNFKNFENHGFVFQKP
jgi:hypothetical protein